MTMPLAQEEKISIIDSVPVNQPSFYTLTENEDFSQEKKSNYTCWLISPDYEPSRFEIKDAPSVSWFKKSLEKLSNLYSLKENWDDEGAKRIDLKAILVAMKVLAQIVKDDTPEPYIFPTLGGGVQIEWHTEKADLEIEIDHEMRMIVIFEDETGMQKNWEQELFDYEIETLNECISKLI
jgi:hypothetical protein